MDVDELPLYFTESELLEHKRVSYFHKIINGGIAGVVGVGCVFPLDLIKTRLQNVSGTPAYHGITHCARSIWAAAPNTLLSKIRAFYAGSSVNLLLVTPEKAIKLVANDAFRHALAAYPGQTDIGVRRGMLAGGCAGFCQVIITTPMELLKIQLQKTAYTLFQEFIAQKGIFGLYQGITSTLARDVTFSDEQTRTPIENEAQRRSLLVVFHFGSDCRCFRLVDGDTYRRGEDALSDSGVYQVFRGILRDEGVRGLFRGASCRAMVVAPLFGVAQATYYFGVAEKIFPPTPPIPF